MAHLTGFSYYHGNTLLHRIDIRIKLLSFILLTLTTLAADTPGLLLISSMASAALVILKDRIFRIFYELRFFMIFLIFIFIIQSISTPGSSLFQHRLIPFTWEGIDLGSRLIWRMLLIVLFSMVLVSTSTASETKEALKRFFRPVPFIPEERLAMMITLMIRFIPVILEQIHEIQDAQRARCVEKKKNPFYRIKYLAIPLFRELFESAGELSEALESRCFSEKSTPITLSSSRIDWLILAFVLSGCLVILLP
ncbi:MAG: energy-coupling factor transporter transmembrane component T [Thermodesulfobacteriota bacterium]